MLKYQALPLPCVRVRPVSLSGRVTQRAEPVRPSPTLIGRPSAPKNRFPPEPAPSGPDVAHKESNGNGPVQPTTPFATPPTQGTPAPTLNGQTTLYESSPDVKPGPSDVIKAPLGNGVSSVQNEPSAKAAPPARPTLPSLPQQPTQTSASSPPQRPRPTQTNPPARSQGKPQVAASPTPPSPPAAPARPQAPPQAAVAPTPPTQPAAPARPQAPPQAAVAPAPSPPAAPPQAAVAPAPSPPATPARPQTPPQAAVAPTPPSPSAAPARPQAPLVPPQAQPNLSASAPKAATPAAPVAPMRPQGARAPSLPPQTPPPPATPQPPVASVPTPSPPTPTPQPPSSPFTATTVSQPIPAPVRPQPPAAAVSPRSRTQNLARASPFTPQATEPIAEATVPSPLTRPDTKPPASSPANPMAVSPVRRRSRLAYEPPKTTPPPSWNKSPVDAPGQAAQAAVPPQAPTMRRRSNTFVPPSDPVPPRAPMPPPQRRRSTIQNKAPEQPPAQRAPSGEPADQAPPVPFVAPDRAEGGMLAPSPFRPKQAARRSSPAEPGWKPLQPEAKQEEAELSARPTPVLARAPVRNAAGRAAVQPVADKTSRMPPMASPTGKAAPPSGPGAQQRQFRGQDRKPGSFNDRGRMRGGRGRNDKGGGSGKMTAENRRRARQMKKEASAAKRNLNKNVREEVFEVPKEGFTCAKVAELLAVNTAEVVKVLFMKGIMVQVNQQLDVETVRLAAAAFGVEAFEEDETQVTDMAKGKADFLLDDDLEFLEPRPPVVCVMGHVDHGKTSLLDRIRESTVAEGEAGGITQSIGAYNVDVPLVEGSQGVSQICFLDTPGHEAFSAMRARGAMVTDIAIIIVAADDGVRPQTLEAVAHARSAGVPMVVAVNKIDKPGAEIERVMAELSSQAELMPEEWGGDVPFVNISAKKGDGIEELLETVALVAELEEFQANPERAAQGTVLESHLDKQTGPVCSLLVQAGTLRKGDIVQAGAAYGRVRSCCSSRGTEEVEARPSHAVSVVGLNSVPAAGDLFRVFESESDAREAAEEEKEALRKARLAEMSTATTVTLSTLATIDDEQEALQRMNVIVKTDATGTLEAVRGALLGLPQHTVSLRFLLASTGPVTPSDVELAKTSGGHVLAFNVDVPEEALALAKQKGVEIKTYNVIYDLLDDMRTRMEGRIKSVREKVFRGSADVRATFGRGKNIIAGCLVTEGKLMRSGVVEVSRGRKTAVYEGELTSLRRFKDEVDVVEEGVECGVGCTGFWEWEEGDRITFYELVEKTLSLEESHADVAVDFDETMAEFEEEYQASLREANERAEQLQRNA